MPGAFQLGLPPYMWGITMQQLRHLAEHVREFYFSKSEDPATKSMRDVVRDIIKPQTRGTGAGYALFLNKHSPVHAQNMISHSWDEHFLEFVDALGVVSEALGTEGLWICSLAIFQKCFDDDGPGPTIQEQLGANIFEGPFVAVVREAKRMLVVQTKQAHVYTRLWCVLELYKAIEMEVDVALLGSWTWESSQDIQPENAVCHDESDATQIKSAIEATCGWHAIARTIVRRVKTILATRAEWPLIRPWEWKLLEAIRLDDARLVHEAASDQDTKWDVRVGSTYGDPSDAAHVYHLVMSFGDLEWQVGLTLHGVARLNGRANAARAIAEAPKKALGSLPEDLVADCGDSHATRDEGPFVRSWEWHLLEAIRCDDASLVEIAASDLEVNWDVRVGEMYGRLSDTNHVYHLIASFGLQWEVGYTLMDIAELNGSLEAAAAIRGHGTIPGFQPRPPRSKCCSLQ